QELHGENEGLFMDFEPDPQDIPKHIIYSVYNSLCCHYAQKHDEAARVINTLLNEVSLKKYPAAMLEIKSVLALQYVLLKDVELFNQLTNSIQRQVRLLGRDNLENIQLFMKMLKIAVSEAKRDKEKKIRSILAKLASKEIKYFTPTLLIRMDDKMINQLINI